MDTIPMQKWLQNIALLAGAGVGAGTSRYVIVRCTFFLFVLIWAHILMFVEVTEYCAEAHVLSFYFACAIYMVYCYNLFVIS